MMEGFREGEKLSGKIAHTKFDSYYHKMRHFVILKQGMPVLSRTFSAFVFRAVAKVGEKGGEVFAPVCDNLQN